jgi:hypothetical protein
MAKMTDTEKLNLLIRDDPEISGKMYARMKMHINEATVVDAVEVVRCKDCWKSADGLCSYQLKNVPGKDFCGDGERKDK